MCIAAFVVRFTQLRMPVVRCCKKICLLRTKQVSSYTKLGLKNKHHVLLQLSLEVYAFDCSQFLDVLYATIPRRSLVFLSGEIYCDLDRLYIIYF
jgi:hypothetical protein